MAGIAKTTKEDIINAAYEIVRKQGIDSLNARALAKKLKCSTQPIMYQFSNMEEIKKEVLKKAIETYKSYMSKGINEEFAYRAMGHNYIRLAKEEPNIFKLVFSTRTNLTVENFMLEDRFYEKIEKAISKQTKMGKDEILSFHKKMWLLTHGIASLIADKTCSFTDEEINIFLAEEFIALMKLEEFKNSDEWKKIKKELGGNVYEKEII